MTRELAALLFLLLPWSSSAATLDDLKKLEIICFVPSHLPEGFGLTQVSITYDEQHQESDDINHGLPLYGEEYGNRPGRTGGEATFSIESAREGIGDRNLMAEEDAEETEIQSPLGRMYLIYRPKGESGRKIEIKANWMSDANMIAETAKDAAGHPVLGRFHGFSATNITVAEFTKIVQSLHPIRPNPAAAKVSAPMLKIHPKVFSMIDCWISDSDGPVMTEVNLDAVERNGNEFNQDGVKADGEWLRCPTAEINGFMRYKVLEWKGNHYTIEYQENGGGSLTTASIIEFEIDKRNIRRDGKLAPLRVLRVLSYQNKKSP
ncbi:MAG: hypothetical protein ABI925_04550 [Verrucomicrobiota bacterium]